MDEMSELLNVYFKKVDDLDEEEPNNNKMLCEGDYWEIKEPKEVEAWSLKMVPHMDNMHFNMKYKKSTTFIFISFDKKMKKISDGIFLEIKIHCATVKSGLPPDKQYHFMLLVNSSKIFFSISPFSLKAWNRRLML